MGWQRAGKDPHTGVTVELDGEVVAHFQEFGAPAGSVELFEIKEGGLDAISHKFTTRGTAADIELKRGFLNGTELFDWFQDTALTTAPIRKDGAIGISDDNGNEIGKWYWHRGLPLKWSGPTFNAMQGAVAVESLTIACEWIEWVPAGSQPEVVPPPPPPPPPPAAGPPPQINFPNDSAELTPAQTAALQNWAASLPPNKTVKVEGYTSSPGTPAHNQQLSEARAKSVADALGWPPVVSAIGYGETNLKFNADGTENQAASRRTDIIEL